MALTLLEAAHQITDPYASGAIETFARGNTIGSVMPRAENVGNVAKETWETELGTIANRGYNEAYTEGSGKTKEYFYSLKIFGGDIDVDPMLLRGYGAEKRIQLEIMKIKAMARFFEKKFFKGSTATNQKEPDGLQQISADIYNEGWTDQVVVNATNGAGLSLAKLDLAIDNCQGCNALFMSHVTATKFAAAARTSTVGGYITFAPNEMGVMIGAYNGIPIYPIWKDESKVEILGFTETTGSSSVTSSVYCVNMSLDDGVYIADSGVPSIKDLGEIDSKAVLRSRLDWMAAPSVKSPLALVRLQGVTNAAITA